MEQNSFRSLARNAKLRMKNGFWKDCKENVSKRMEQAKDLGMNENKAERFLRQEVQKNIRGETEDEFYEKVKRMLSEYGEVSDAIGRLTDKAYYETLSYDEKQRYTLHLSERYLKALERFRKDVEFSVLQSKK